MSRVPGPGGSHKKLSNSLVALSSAAVLAVYTAGYLRTKPAADRIAIQAAARRPSIPAPPLAAPVPSPVLQAPVVTVPRSTEAAPRSTATAKARKPSRVAPPKVVAETPSALPPPAVTAVPALPASAAVVVERSEPAPVPPVPPVPEPPKLQYKDGTYLGWGTSRHGDIQAQVVIEGGRIASATIAQCLTRYDCSVIAKLPPQVAQRQSPETDYVSGATQSTNAFYYAVVDALSKAK
jgi:uncharacterized protein with FMN-binding domain